MTEPRKTLLFMGALLIGALCSLPLLSKENSALEITIYQSKDDKGDKGDPDDDGWGLIRYRLILPEKLKDETLTELDLAQQNQLLAKYNE